MSKKMLAIIITFILIANLSFSFAATSYAKGSSPRTSSRSGSFSSKGSSFHNTPNSQSNSSSSSGGFSGGSSGKVTSPSNSSGFSGGASNKSNVPNSSSTNSGYHRTNVNDGSRINPNNGRAYYGGSSYMNSPPIGYHGSSFWPVVGAFAAGSMLGSMIHPWGGYYPIDGGGYVHQPFSFLTLLMDVFIIIIAIWIVAAMVRFFRRSRY